jgi:hypothetical protein
MLFFIDQSDFGGTYKITACCSFELPCFRFFFLVKKERLLSFIDIRFIGLFS